MPFATHVIHANRYFLGRAVRFCVQQGMAGTQHRGLWAAVGRIG